MPRCSQHGRTVYTRNALYLAQVIALLFLGPCTLGFTWLFVPLVLLALLIDRPRCVYCRRPV